MKLTQTAVLALNGTSAEFKSKLADELNVSPASIYSWISKNESNGPLTRIKAVQMISEEIGIDQDKILEDSKEMQDRA